MRDIQRFVVRNAKIQSGIYSIVIICFAIGSFTSILASANGLVQPKSGKLLLSPSKATNSILKQMLQKGISAEQFKNLSLEELKKGSNSETISNSSARSGGGEVVGGGDIPSSQYYQVAESLQRALRLLQKDDECITSHYYYKLYSNYNRGDQKFEKFYTAPMNCPELSRRIYAVLESIEGNKTYISNLLYSILTPYLSVGSNKDIALMNYFEQQLEVADRIDSAVLFKKIRLFLNMIKNQNNNKEFLSAWDYLKQSRLQLRLNRPCVAGKIHHKDASVTGLNIGADICFDANKLSRISPASLDQEVFALLAHEMAHLNGYNEVAAESVQNFLSYNWKRFHYIEGNSFFISCITIIADKITRMKDALLPNSSDELDKKQFSATDYLISVAKFEATIEFIISYAINHPQELDSNHTSVDQEALKNSLQILGLNINLLHSNLGEKVVSELDEHVRKLNFCETIQKYEKLTANVLQKLFNQKMNIKQFELFSDKAFTCYDFKDAESVGQ